ncbi:hypothetical protein [Absidia glauca]|uniref:SGNH hydrolase-type esterase domain-containing protein n=1 Tax=Absidia glauca TaxID=4829 RepID=A0A163IWE3_ABSGL|nr:hypothetical protein [Absidia glauca]
MTLQFIVLWLALSGLAAAVPLIQRKSSTFDLEKMTTLFSFGDSYTTEYLDLPTMSYPDHDNVSSTNGANWVYYLTQAEDLTNWDLAYNSAPIQNELVNQNGTNYAADETLYSIWVGINDVGLLLTNHNSTASLDVLMRRYRQLITYLYDHDARNIILINVPPVDRSPKWGAKDETASKMHHLVKGYNQKLLKMARSLSEMKHLRVIYIDAWAIFTRILDHPHQYGLKNVTSSCPEWRHPEKHDCLPIKDYFWLNDLHPTTKVHYHFAKAVQDFLQEMN